MRTNSVLVDHSSAGVQPDPNSTPAPGIKPATRVNLDELQAALATDVERLAEVLLGQPNRALSTRKDLRFGSRGSVSVVISGRKRGQWYDHEAGRGRREGRGCHEADLWAPGIASAGGWVVHKIPIFRTGDGELSVGVPNAAEIGSDGRIKLDKDGKRDHRALITFQNDDARARWRRVVLAALQASGIVP